MQQKAAQTVRCDRHLTNYTLRLIVRLKRSAHLTPLPSCKFNEFNNANSRLESEAPTVLPNRIDVQVPCDKFSSAGFTGGAVASTQNAHTGAAPTACSRHADVVERVLVERLYERLGAAG